MIKNAEPVSMTEAMQYVGKNEGSETDVKGFMKKFVKLKVKEGEELREKIEDLELIKIKPEHISKIIDIVPENADELNKIFSDVGLDEDETKKILDTVKQYK